MKVHLPPAPTTVSGIARLAVLLCFTGMTLASPAAQSAPFAVAIARFDGSLVPFASHRDGEWQRAWPEADQERVGRLAIEAIPSVWQKRGEPVPTRWTAWPSAGGKPIQATVRGVEIVEAHCGAQIALKTNLPTAEVDHHGGKFGIAVDSTAVTIGFIEEVKTGDPAWATAESAVFEAFSRLEATEIARLGRQAQRAVSSSRPTIRVLYRETDSARSPLYFVAERKHVEASAQDPACQGVTVITGWLARSDDGSIKVLTSTTFLTDCDQKTVRTGQPLGAIRDSGRIFWILQEHGYEDESYVIAEIRAGDVRYAIEVSGGGC